jgi:integrase
MNPKVFSIFEPMGRRRSQRKGHLFERSGSWLLRYWVDSAELDPTSGKPKRTRVTLTIADSGKVGIREARRIAWDEYLSKVDEAHTRPSSAKTFLEFVNLRYRPDVIAMQKRSTQAFSESILRRHVLPMLGHCPLRDISPAHVQNVINAKRLQNLSPQTLTHIRNRISAVLRHAKAHRWFFGELPTEAVRLPELTRQERKALNWAEVCTLANALPEPCATLVVFLAQTGLRIGEAMGLRWSRVNLTLEPIQSGSETIPPLSLLVRENYVMNRYQTLKTNSSYRTVLIPAWLARRVQENLPAKNSDGSSVHGLTIVFANTTGSAPIDQHNLARRVLKPVAKSLGMPWVSWHTFRHSHATMTDKAGFTTAERMKLLGHSSASVTMGYSHPELEMIRERVTAMSDPKLLN